MHEMSLCHCLVDAVITEVGTMNPQPKRIVKAVVVIGSMRQVQPDFMKDAFAILTKDTPAEGAELEIKEKRAVGKCDDCGAENQMALGIFSCENCGSIKGSITGGMELYLKSIEIEE